MSNLFEDAGPDPFIDRDRLHDSYIPDEIVERDDAIDDLAEALWPILNGYSPDHVFATGPPGTGKNVCTRFVLNQLKEQVAHDNELREVKAAVTDHLEAECSSKSGVFADQYESTDELLDAYEEKPEALLKVYEEAAGESLVNGLASSFPLEKSEQQEEIIVDALESNVRDQSVALTERQINCKGVSTGYQLAVRITNELRPANEQELKSSGHAPQRVYDEMFSEIQRVGATEDPTEQGIVVLVLDEMGTVDDLDTLFYKLTRANAMGGDLDGVKVGTICLSNSMTFRDEFSPRTESSLRAKHIDFDAYDANELQEILEGRKGNAVREEALEEGVIPLCAALAATKGGDARFALQLLLSAGTKATRGNSRLVTIDHVEAAKEELEQERMQNKVNRLDTARARGLLALCDLQTDSDEWFEKKQIHRHYLQLCSDAGIQGVKERQFHTYLKRCEEIGVVEREERTTPNADLWSLSYPSGKVKEGVDRDIRASFLGEEIDADSQSVESEAASSD